MSLYLIKSFKIAFFTLISCYCLDSIFANNLSAQHAKIQFISDNEKYIGAPQLLQKNSLTNLRNGSQIWNNYCPPCSLKSKALCEKLSCQTHNIKIGNIYDGIEVGNNKWIHLANQVALEGAKHGGGAFGAVAVQVDNTTGNVIRYWTGYNHVKLWHDPTAHGEIVTIRQVSKELGVTDLGHIRKSESKVYQPNEISHIEFYSSAEPCPMCMSAIYWSKIPVLVFAATRFDVSLHAQIRKLTLSDEMLYTELGRPYKERKYIKAYQATTDNSLDVFNWWKRTKK